MGLFALIEVVYKLIKCPNCDESILWFEVSGLVFIIFWTAVAIILFTMYIKRTGQKKKRNNIL